MAIPTSGQIALTGNIAAEFEGGATNVSIGSYYRGGTAGVPNINQNSNIPLSGQISLQNFYNAIDPSSFTYNATDNGISTNSNTYTFSTITFANTKHMVVGVAARDDDVTSPPPTVTIGGVSATQIINQTRGSLGSTVTSIWISNSPMTAASGNVVVSFANTTAMTRCAIHTWRCDRLQSTTAANSGSFANTTTSGTLCTSTLGTSRAGYWTGVLYSYNNRSYTVGTGVTQGNRTVVESQNMTAFYSTSTYIQGVPTGSNTYTFSVTQSGADSGEMAAVGAIF